MRKNYLFIMLLLVSIGITLPAYSQYVVDTNTPLYGKEYFTWGGAATGQMIMDGYPGGNGIYYPQQTVWDTIQLNNSTGEPEPWATDPLGLSQTMIQLNPPLGTWGILTDPVKGEVMFQILYWMNLTGYPAAALVDEGERWVVVKGYETDVEPVQGSNPTLIFITINDPDPLNEGSTYTTDGAVWLATAWIAPVSAEGTWYNLYVAVVEPPVGDGSIQVDPLDRNGGAGKSAISSEDAVDYAKYWIEELKLGEKEPYTDIDFKSIVVREPLLVSEEIDFLLVERDMAPCYYIVPYGYDGKMAEAPGTSILYIIINAFTGKFEEVGKFGKPVTFLSEDQALEAVADYLKLKREELKLTETELVYMPSTITHLRSRPFWRVTLEDETVLFVEQAGKVHQTIIPAPIIYGR